MTYSLIIAQFSLSMLSSFLFISFSLSIAPSMFTIVLLAFSFFCYKYIGLLLVHYYFFTHLFCTSAVHYHIIGGVFTFTVIISPSNLLSYRFHFSVFSSNSYFTVDLWFDFYFICSLDWLFPFT